MFKFDDEFKQMILEYEIIDAIEGDDDVFIDYDSTAAAKAKTELNDITETNVDNELQLDRLRENNETNNETNDKSNKRYYISSWLGL